MNKTRYLEVVWRQYFTEEESEMLVSFLDLIGFDAFHEDDGIFRAYIDSEIFDSKLLAETLSNIPIEKELSIYEISKLPDKNWNEEWEINFPPVIISDSVIVRAPFHQHNTEIPYEIIINPKMSFGTGHHETTSGMLEMMPELDFQGKNVIDMGCGTGILSVFAEKLGASHVTAVDYDFGCFENTKETIQLNHLLCTEVMHGDNKIIAGMSADIILGNINRNILLEHISTYADCLRKHKGYLMMSGFYSEDLGMIDEECMKNDLKRVKYFEKNNWITSLYKII